MSKIGYIRVSTEHQETARQQEIMCSYQVDRIFSEKLSGANTDRPQLRAMLDYVREGDTVYFESFSRVSRSLPDLLNTLDYFAEKGVTFVSLKENIDTTGATGKLIVSCWALSAHMNAKSMQNGGNTAIRKRWMKSVWADRKPLQIRRFMML